jgi:SOUL heme-binding protein
MKKAILWVTAGAAGAAVYGLASVSRAFLEKASYTVERKEGPFEVRDYPALSVASAPMREGERDSAFRRLFRFISRSNERGEKIAMTAPVFIDRGTDQGKMSFVMPRETRERSVPRPADKAVTLEQRPPERVAVYRYSGKTSEENEQRALRALRDWMQSNGLIVAGTPIVAYYDAPFLPPLLRRNEVMLRVKREP